MKKFYKYLGIFFCCFTTLIMFLFVIFLIYSSYREDKQWSASDFNDDGIAISYDKKSEIIDIIKTYISDKYNLPLYLQWIVIRITNSGGNVTKESIECSFNTYKKESNEFGHIFATIYLMDKNFFSLYATFGDDENLESLKENKHIGDKLNDLDIILEAASKKMKEENMDIKKYEYTLDLDKKIVLYNSANNMEYVYDSKNNVFVKSKE